jgi:GT2 family glycosyltransferase
MIALTATALDTDIGYFLDAVKVSGLDSDIWLNQPVNLGCVPAFHRLWEEHKGEDALLYLHTDLEILDANWAERLAFELMDPTVGVVGFGGAMGMGHPDLYKTRYRLEQLARADYWSNQVGWQVHGRQETGERDVAVLDGFMLAVKGELLKRIGGWSWFPFGFHCYDTSLCLMAHRLGYRVRMVGVRCDHHGGGTSTKPEYVEWLRERGRTVEQDHVEPHLWQMNEFRSELPILVR